MRDKNHEFIVNVDRETRDKVVAAAKKRSQENGERLSENISDIFSEAVEESLKEDSE